MSGISEKKLFVILIVVAVGVTGTFGALGLRERDRIAETEGKISRLHGEIEKFKRQSLRIPLLEMEIEGFASRHEDNLLALPVGRYEDALLKGIQALANDTGVKLSRVEPMADRRKRGAPTGSEPWTPFRLAITAEGPYFSLLEFMNSLEHYPRLLSLLEGKFRSVRTHPREEEGGPILELALGLEAYTARPSLHGRKTGPTGEASPRWGLGDGPVFRLGEDFRIPDSSVINLNDRRNPFAIWLEKNREPSDEVKGDPEPKKRSMSGSARVEEWWRDLAIIQEMIVTGRDPVETYGRWTELAVDTRKTALSGRDAVESEKIQVVLHSEEVKGVVLARFDDAVVRFVRSGSAEMEVAAVTERGGDVGGSFLEFLSKVCAWDRFPQRAARSFESAVTAFEAWARDQVEEEGRTKEVLDILGGVEGVLAASRQEERITHRLAEVAGVWKAKAKILDEFHTMGLSVSGLFWLPAGASLPSVAIVNGMAVEEGQEFTSPLSPRDGREGPTDRLILLQVSRDRHVFLEYKGMNIKLEMGEPGR
ncbi:MAG: type 4a pilus biogenesis protein PilO [Planctomycetota bacterium]|jgi:Tfp pilus assembly protein PilO